jgi:hypothetical protein
MKTELTYCPETSAHKIQKPGDHPKESIQHLVHGEKFETMLIFIRKQRESFCLDTQ